MSPCIHPSSRMSRCSFASYPLFCHGGGPCARVVFFAFEHPERLVFALWGACGRGAVLCGCLWCLPGQTQRVGVFAFSPIDTFPAHSGRFMYAARSVRYHTSDAWQEGSGCLGWGGVGPLCVLFHARGERKNAPITELLPGAALWDACDAELWRAMSEL